MMIKLMAVLLMMSSFVYADDAIQEIDYIREMSDSDYRKNNAKMHKAEGLHQCQSDKSIGHSCKNLGVNFTDCNQAFFLLKRDDCCAGSEYGGVSIAFKMTKCSTIY